jgi:DNA-binding PadR family transcriptional regulator
MALLCDPPQSTWPIRHDGWLNPRIGARPLCPLVLSLLARQPRQVHDVARALSGAGPGTAADRYHEALTTLDRLRDGGLVRRRAVAAGPLYEITRRGRSELRLQRLLWARLVQTR